MHNYKLRRISLVDGGVFVMLLHLVQGLFGFGYALIYLDGWINSFGYLLIQLPLQGFIIGVVLAVLFNVYGRLAGGFRVGIDTFQEDEVLG
ncbi:MAG: hypothetical protein RLN76_11715 [Phycisphaeraceae bacterium]